MMMRMMIMWSCSTSGRKRTTFWKLPGSSPLVSTTLLCCAGFFIYGPQALVGITAANLATKRAAATAIGFTGIFGYASTILSGWGLGKLVDDSGWNAGLMALIFMAARSHWPPSSPIWLLSRLLLVSCVSTQAHY